MKTSRATGYIWVWGDCLLELLDQALPETSKLFSYISQQVPFMSKPPGVEVFVLFCFCLLQPKEPYSKQSNSPCFFPSQ